MPFDTASDVSLDGLSDASYDSDDYQLAQQEWEESIQQLQQLVSMVLLPVVGKYLGRKWSYWCKHSPTLKIINAYRSFFSVCTLRSSHLI